MIVIVPLIIVIGFLIWVLRPGTRPTNPRKVAILATAIPVLIVAIAAVVFQIVHNSAGTITVSDISNTCFIISLVLIGAYILATIGYALTHKSDIAKGVGFGTCTAVIIAIVELGLLEWLGGV